MELRDNLAQTLTLPRHWTWNIIVIIGIIVVRRSSFVVRRRLRILYGDVVVMILFYIIQLDSILPSLVSREFGREDGMHACISRIVAACY